ncbi:hypothetical protein [Chelativorans salis]|uniref:Uncharacterized protein n=1 Tax=Chelativorans salis TaxID=2978478 RepID=A0ABT2LUX4_9HYPH|nr:hypothetical protein [Chelativorans sp. EGI FJ00035]MCT7378332.1 hypothetical protein [Chelativorans sp. EGI FJ00035]
MNPSLTVEGAGGVKTLQGVGDVELAARLFYEFETRKQWADAKPAVKETWLKAARQFHDVRRRG